MWSYMDFFPSPPTTRIRFMDSSSLCPVTPFEVLWVDKGCIPFWNRMFQLWDCWIVSLTLYLIEGGLCLFGVYIHYGQVIPVLLYENHVKLVICSMFDLSAWYAICSGSVPLFHMLKHTNSITTLLYLDMVTVICVWKESCHDWGSSLLCWQLKTAVSARRKRRGSEWRFWRPSGRRHLRKLWLALRPRWENQSALWCFFQVHSCGVFLHQFSSDLTHI